VIGIKRVKQRWKKCIDNQGDFVKNNTNFENEAPVINIKFIINVPQLLREKGKY
jgi:hypothetical protein